MSLSYIFFPGIIPKVELAILNSNLNKKLKTLLVSPAGPLTIHFWAPTFKWCISLANLSNIQCPTEKLSPETQLAITMTGLIWSRFSMVVRPKNWNLFWVNIMMALTGLYQLNRIYWDRMRAGKE